jgi:hypothetical protein
LVVLGKMDFQMKLAGNLSLEEYKALDKEARRAAHLEAKRNVQLEKVSVSPAWKPRPPTRGCVVIGAKTVGESESGGAEGVAEPHASSPARLQRH